MTSTTIYISSNWEEPSLSAAVRTNEPWNDNQQSWTKNSSSGAQANQRGEYAFSIHNVAGI